MDSIEEHSFRDSREIEITPLFANNQQQESEIDTNNKPAITSPLSRTLLFTCQFKALLYKTTSFQLKQTATNIFQLFAPLICIFIIWVAQNEIIKEFKDSYNFTKINGIPFFLNMPFSFLSKSSAYPIALDDCNKWMMYKDNRDPFRFGGDDYSAKDILHEEFYEMCASIGRPVPYFIETRSNLNDNLSSVLEVLNAKNITAGEEVEGLDQLPDAGITIKALNKHKIDVDLQINDNLFIEFHRNNGFTKQSFKIPKDPFSLFSTQNLNMTDLLSSSTMKLTEHSKKLLNKTQTSFQRLFKNKERTFPVM